MGKSSEFSEIGSELRPLKFAQILTARMALFSSAFSWKR